jgi:hypothetical protein
MRSLKIRPARINGHRVLERTFSNRGAAEVFLAVIRKTGVFGTVYRPPFSDLYMIVLTELEV